MSTHKSYYHEDTKVISSITFSILGSTKIIQSSAITDAYDGISSIQCYSNFDPVKSGLLDARMGTSDIFLRCSTCGENSNDCPGHIGHTNLSEAVFHAGFIDHIRKILKCICIKCSILLIPKTDKLIKTLLSKPSELRFKDVQTLTYNIHTCYQCNSPVPSIRKDDKSDKDNGYLKIIIDYSTYVDKKHSSKLYLYAPDCYNILRNLPDIDTLLLGMNPKIQRPEDMILKTIVIPPVSLRPSSKIDLSSPATMQDGLTIIISKIIESDKRLRKHIEKYGHDGLYQSIIYTLLQVQIAAIFNNDKSAYMPEIKFKSGDSKVESISQRISGKHGRLRSNLMGKRVDFSGRSVITPDPMIGIDEVGIPKQIAMELTIPVVVTERNINKMTDTIKLGATNYPGANFIIKYTTDANGNKKTQKIDLRYRKTFIDLSIGDIVERHLVNGDVVLFNRHPTLHKSSMMGHKIFVLESRNSFGINPGVAKPYAADFDGDEMNIHIPQSIQTQYEIRLLANVKNQIIGIRNSNPLIAPTEDTITGAFILTDPTVKIKGSNLANLLSYTTLVPKILYDIDINKEYTGLEAFSFIIPKGITMQNKSAKIVDGKIISGRLDSSLIGASRNSIIHFIWDKYGPDVTTEFINNVEKFILIFLINYGMTLKPSDALVDKTTIDEIKTVYTKTTANVKQLIKDFELNTRGLTNEDIEKKIKEQLDLALPSVSKILNKDYTLDNFLWTSMISGAKGGVTKFAQVCGMIGQQTFQSGRIKNNIEERSMIYFAKHDDNPEARGFITSKYIDGMNSIDMFINAMAGRDGYIDTVLKSVTYDTMIFISTKDSIKYIAIGEWIDDLMIRTTPSIDEKTGSEEMMLDFPVWIPCTDSEGIINWHKITHATRHDPTKKSFRITTKSKKVVTVSDSKSLIIYNQQNKIVEEHIRNIKVGDCIPITDNLTAPPSLENTRLIGNKTFELNYCFGKFIGIIHRYKNNINSNVINLINITNKKIFVFLKKFCELNDIWKISDIENFIIIDNGLKVYLLNNEINFPLGILGNTSSECIKGYIDIIEPEDTDVYLYLKSRISNSYYGYTIPDEIIEIEEVAITEKMYDITVPPTFNFSIANGIHVRDTAETGYMHRQLTKTLEDESVQYDGTVRNTKHQIIQFVYADCGIKQNMQNHVELFILNMEDDKIYEMYGDLSEKMIEYRDHLLHIQAVTRMDYETKQTTYQLPINLLRIYQSYTNKKGNGSLQSEHVIKRIKQFLNSHKKLPKYILEIALFQYFAPKRCIEEYKMDKKLFDEMIDEIELCYLRALAEPGDMVGIITAQSVGEPLSQMSLDTKHFTGLSSRGLGYSGSLRIQEILHNTNTKGPIMYLYFNESIRNNLNKINLIISELKSITLEELVDDIEIYYEHPNDPIKDNIMHPFFVGQDVQTDMLPFVIKLKLNWINLIMKNISMLDIKIAYIKYFQQFHNTKNIIKKNIKDIIPNIINSAIYSNLETDSEPIIHIRLSLVKYNSNILINLSNIILKEIVLKGMPNILNVEEPSERSLVTKDGVIKEYTVAVHGINLDEICYIKGIDINRTYCNNINIINKTYGIEAARHILVHELYDAYIKANSSINISHLSLLGDHMCYTGDIVSIDRHGLSKLDVDPIHRASFENTMEHFVNASLYNNKDYVTSTSSRIALGRPIKGGTACFDITVDIEKLILSERTDADNPIKTGWVWLTEDPIMLI